MAGVKGKSGGARVAPGNGGARPGAGRKPLREKYAAPLNKAEKAIAVHLPKAAANLVTLADGGFVRTEKKFMLAASMTRSDIARDKEGNPLCGQNGKPIRVDVLIFPHIEPTEFVEVERKEITLAPDRAANEYLIDRIAGKPIQANEISGPDGSDIPLPAIELSERQLGVVESLLKRGQERKERGVT